MGAVRLRPGYVPSIWAGHPWVFAQAIASVDGAPAAGDPINVSDPRGQFLGRGYFEPGSTLAVRILSYDPDDALEEAFLARRLEAAAALRRDLGLPRAETTGYRLVNGEGDQLAGLVVDVYADVAIVQLLTTGMRRRVDALVGHIARLSGARTVLHAATTPEAAAPLAERVLRGAEPSALAFREGGLELEMPFDIARKTGFAFDQREHRERVGGLAGGRRVLDLFAFVGSFGLAAARGGAESVTCIESSAAAVAVGGMIARKNGVAARMKHERADVKRALPDLAAAKARFDLIVCDPPKLVATARDLERGRGAYRKLNASALRLCEPGGFFVTSSYSAALGPDDFLRVLATSARDAGRRLSLVHLGQQAPDHPTPPVFAQGRYLKTAFFRVSA